MESDDPFQGCPPRPSFVPRKHRTFGALVPASDSQSQGHHRLGILRMAKSHLHNKTNVTHRTNRHAPLTPTLNSTSVRIAETNFKRYFNKISSTKTSPDTNCACSTLGPSGPTTTESGITLWPSHGRPQNFQFNHRFWITHVHSCTSAREANPSGTLRKRGSTLIINRVVASAIKSVPNGLAVPPNPHPCKIDHFEQRRMRLRY